MNKEKNKEKRKIGTTGLNFKKHAASEKKPNHKKKKNKNQPKTHPNRGGGGGKKHTPNTRSRHHSSLTEESVLREKLTKSKGGKGGKEGVSGKKPVGENDAKRESIGVQKGWFHL